MKELKKDLQARIDSLQPGKEILISKRGGITCTAERSPDGKVMRFVRTFPNGNFEVYNSQKL